MRQFTRFAHHYIDRVPSAERRLEWLSIMQHYGAPTRLLDFTRSPYVAAFFALEERSDRPHAIWAINELVLKELLPLPPPTAKQEADGWLMTGLIRRKGDHLQGVVPVEPFRLHERLAIQQGLFLAPLNIGCSFESNLFSMFGFTSEAANDIFKRGFMPDVERSMSDLVKRVVIRFELAPAIRSEALADLRRMNVSAATLYPGLEGFARSLRHLMVNRDHENAEG